MQNFVLSDGRGILLLAAICRFYTSAKTPRPLGSRRSVCHKLKAGRGRAASIAMMQPRLAPLFLIRSRKRSWQASAASALERHSYYVDSITFLFLVSRPACRVG